MAKLSDDGAEQRPPQRPPGHERFESRITVDLDAKDYSHSGFRLRATRCWHNLQQIADYVDAHVSSSGKGLHLVAWFEQDLAFHEQVHLRRGAGDDVRRVDMDIQRWQEGLYTDVLFADKDQRPQSKERRFEDVYDALDYIDNQRDDYNRVHALAQRGHKADPELARRAQL